MSRLARAAITSAFALSFSWLALGPWGQAFGAPPAPSPSPTPSGATTPTPTPTGGTTPTPTPDETPDPTPSETSEPSPGPTTQLAPGDVTLAWSAADTDLEVGDRTTVDVVVSNPVGAPERVVTLTLSLPLELDLGSSSPVGVPQGWGDGVTEWELGPLAGGTSVPITLQIDALEETASGGELATLAVNADDGSSVTEQFVLAVTSPEIVKDLDLEVASTRPFLASVGQTVDFTYALENPTEEPLRNVVVVERVADELDVSSAPLAEGVDAVQVGRHGNSEDIVWIVTRLEPGKRIKLPWSATVAKSGDLKATGSVVARARGVDATNERVDTYLAAPPAPPEERSPSFTPIIRRIPVVVPASSGGTGLLPATGPREEVLGFLALGVVAMLAGLAFHRFGSPSARGKRIPAAVALTCILLAACVSESGDRPSANTTPQTPQVKGRRIQRGDDPATRPQPTTDPDDPTTEPTTEPGDEGDGNDGDGGNDGNDDPAPNDNGGDDDDFVAPPPAEDDPDGDGLIETFVLREVGLVDLPVRTFDEDGGRALAAFSWDESSHSVVGGGSSLSLAVGAPAVMRSEVTRENGGITVKVIVRNTSENRRVAIDGRIVHTVAQQGRLIKRFRSDRIDTILSPGGRTTARFTYLLPSGSYGTTARFAG